MLSIIELYCLWSRSGSNPAKKGTETQAWHSRVRSNVLGEVHTAVVPGFVQDTVGVFGLNEDDVAVPVGVVGMVLPGVGADQVLDQFLDDVMGGMVCGDVVRVHTGRRAASGGGLTAREMWEESAHHLLWWGNPLVLKDNVQRYQSYILCQSMADL